MNIKLVSDDLHSVPIDFALELGRLQVLDSNADYFLMNIRGNLTVSVIYFLEFCPIVRPVLLGVKGVYQFGLNITFQIPVPP